MGFPRESSNLSGDDIFPFSPIIRKFVYSEKPSPYPTSPKLNGGERQSLHILLLHSRKSEVKSSISYPLTDGSLRLHLKLIFIWSTYSYTIFILSRNFYIFFFVLKSNETKENNIKKYRYYYASSQLFSYFNVSFSFFIFFFPLFYFLFFSGQVEINWFQNTISCVTIFYAYICFVFTRRPYPTNHRIFFFLRQYSTIWNYQFDFSCVSVFAHLCYWLFDYQTLLLCEFDNFWFSYLIFLAPNV